MSVWQYFWHSLLWLACPIGSALSTATTTDNGRKMMNVNTEVTKRNLACFGKDAVLDNSIEELAELIQAIQKMKRSDGYFDNKRTDLIMEMADVYIVLENLKDVYSIDDIAIQFSIDIKQQRQVERIAMRLSEK